MCRLNWWPWCRPKWRPRCGPRWWPGVGWSDSRGGGVGQLPRVAGRGALSHVQAKQLLEPFSEDDQNNLVVLVGTVLVPDDVSLPPLGRVDPFMYLLHGDGGLMFIAYVVIGLAVYVVDGVDRGDPAVQLRQGEGVSAELHTAQQRNF